MLCSRSLTVDSEVWAWSCPAGSLAALSLLGRRPQALRLEAMRIWDMRNPSSVLRCKGRAGVLCRSRGCSWNKKLLPDYPAGSRGLWARRPYVPLVWRRDSQLMRYLDPLGICGQVTSDVNRDFGTQDVFKQQLMFGIGLAFSM